MVLFSESIPPQRWAAIMAYVHLSLRSGGVQTGLDDWTGESTQVWEGTPQWAMQLGEEHLEGGLLELGSTYVLVGCETVNLCDLDPTFSRMFNPPSSANVCVCFCVCVCVCVGDGAQLSLFGGSAGKESACQCRRCKRHGFDPWVRKIH